MADLNDYLVELIDEGRLDVNDEDLGKSFYEIVEERYPNIRGFSESPGSTAINITRCEMVVNQYLQKNILTKK